MTNRSAVSCTHPVDRPVAEPTGAKRARLHRGPDARSIRTSARAAASEAMTVSGCVRSSAIAAAERMFEPRPKIALPAIYWDAFQDALLDPPEPNAILRAAAHRCRERVGG